MVDFDQFTVGAVDFPLATSGTLLEDADPALAIVLDFVASVLDTYAGDRFNAAVNGCGLAQLDGYIVRSMVPYDPIPDLQVAQQWSKMPLLALHRTEAGFTEYPIATTNVVDRWILDYVLPTLTPAQTERLYPILAAVEKIVMDRVSMGFDPAFQGGANVFEQAGITTIKFIKRQYQTFPYREGDSKTTLHFRMISITLEVTEQTVPSTDSFEDLTGIDGYVSIVDPDHAFVDGYAFDLNAFILNQT